MLETQRVLHDDMSRLEECAEQVDDESFDTLRIAQYDCVDKVDEIKLKVNKIEQKMGNLHALMKIHHNALDDGMAKVLLKIEQMEQKIDKMMTQ